MTKQRLRLIRGHLVGLKAVFHEPATGPGADDLIITVRALCGSISEALQDNRCREHLDLIELYAADLFSNDQTTRLHAPSSATDSLKQKINKCLTTVAVRLLELETAVA